MKIPYITNLLRTELNKAVENLVLKDTDKVYILAFSIGGFIAWKAMQ